MGRAFIPLAPGRPARRGGLMGEGQPDCLNDWISKARKATPAGFASIERHPRGTKGPSMLRYPTLPLICPPLSQSSRAGMTQRAIRSPSSLKRPSCLSMKPTVARRFSHWDNVPTLPGPPQPTKQTVSELEVPPPQKLFVLLCAVARCAQPVTSSSRPCRSLTNRAAGGFLWNSAGPSPCANGPSGLRNRDF